MFVLKNNNFVYNNFEVNMCCLLLFGWVLCIMIESWVWVVCDKGFFD